MCENTRQCGRAEHGRTVGCAAPPDNARGELFDSPRRGESEGVAVRRGESEGVAVRRGESEGVAVVQLSLTGVQ